MGWWKVQGTEHLVGDEVFDRLRDATISVAATYEKEFGRVPTRDEWLILIRDALQPVQEDDANAPLSLFHENAEPASIDIQLQPMVPPR